MKNHCTSEHPDGASTQVADERIHCLRCGYALCGLDVTGNCPECGTSIESSMRLMRHPSHQATGIRLFAWSFTSVFGLLLLSCAPAMFLLVAFSGTVLRGVAILRFRRAQLHRLPVLSSRLAWLSVSVAVEFVLLVCLALYAMQTNWTFVAGSPTATMGGTLPNVILMWAWLLAMNISVLLAVMIVTVHARRLEHEVVLLQLRTTSRCILAAIVLGALASFVTLWVYGLDPAIVLFGLATHGLVAMVAAGHGITAFSKLVSAIRAEA